MTDTLTTLKERLAEVFSLNQASAVLGWDMQCYMPPGGAGARARQLSVLSKLSHEMFIADETGRLIDAAERGIDGSGAGDESDDVSLVHRARRDYVKARKVPASLVAELASATALGHEVWVKARAENDFKSFIPSLRKIVDLTKRAAECVGYKDHIYDAMLDMYEEGLTTADVAHMFADLREDLVPLVKAISARANAVKDDILHQKFDEDKQRQFSEMVVKKFGYDFERGRQDKAVHPFCTSFSRNDVRITTRFDPKWLNPALFGTLHEAGHGMYEQGVAESLEGNILAGGTSLGVHESQSRLWENVVGRSRGFWQHFYPQLQKLFQKQLGQVDLETFYRAINAVKPSFIRVEADEATYNLHIMLRFELEADMVAGALKLEDLPEAWNAKFKDYVGIVPPTDTLGVLQDIHWSSGLIGYFPTYSMGNLLSVPLFNKAVEAHPAIPREIARGEFGTLLGWLRENVHKYGRKYEPKELVRRATGRELESKSYVRYLKAKYSDIYGL